MSSSTFIFMSTILQRSKKIWTKHIWHSTHVVNSMPYEQAPEQHIGRTMLTRKLQIRVREHERSCERDLSAIEPVYQHYCRAKNCRQLESFYQRFKTQVISKAISRKFLVHCKIITVVKFTSVSNQCSLGLEAISSSSMPQNYWTILGWF